jgi:hypothetical protein
MLDMVFRLSKILVRFQVPRHRFFKGFVPIFMSVQKELVLEQMNSRRPEGRTDILLLSSLSVCDERYSLQDDLPIAGAEA